MLTVGLITVVCTVLAIIISGIAWWESHGDRGDRRAREAAGAVASAAVTPVAQAVAVLESRTGLEARERDRLIIKGMISEIVAPVNTEMARIDVRLQMMDENWKQLASEMVKVLHHPIPERAHVDALLDGYEEGMLDSGEWLELRRHLAYIRSWEPGTPSDYPIYPGEQTAAAILLQVMNMSEPKGGQHAASAS